MSSRKNMICLSRKDAFEIMKYLEAKRETIENGSMTKKELLHKLHDEFEIPITEANLNSLLKDCGIEAKFKLTSKGGSATLMAFNEVRSSHIEIKKYLRVLTNTLIAHLKELGKLVKASNLEELAKTLD